MCVIKGRTEEKLAELFKGTVLVDKKKKKSGGGWVKFSYANIGEDNILGPN